MNVQGVSASGLSNELSRLCANLVSALAHQRARCPVRRPARRKRTAAGHVSRHCVFPRLAVHLSAVRFPRAVGRGQKQLPAWLRSLTAASRTHAGWMNSAAAASGCRTRTPSAVSSRTRCCGSMTARWPSSRCWPTPDDTALITTYHLSYPWQAIAPYTLSRLVDNAYAVPLGFGADYRGGTGAGRRSRRPGTLLRSRGRRARDEDARGLARSACSGSPSPRLALRLRAGWTEHRSISFTTRGSSATTRRPSSTSRTRWRRARGRCPRRATEPLFLQRPRAAECSIR